MLPTAVMARLPHVHPVPFKKSSNLVNRDRQNAMYANSLAGELARAYLRWAMCLCDTIEGSAR